MCADLTLSLRIEQEENQIELLIYLAGVFFFFLILYFVIKAAVRNGIVDAQIIKEEYKNANTSENHIKKITCPKCNEEHDIDFSKCPHCNFKYI